MAFVLYSGSVKSFSTRVNFLFTCIQVSANDQVVCAGNGCGHVRCSRPNTTNRMHLASAETIGESTGGANLKAEAEQLTTSDRDSENDLLLLLSPMLRQAGCTWSIACEGHRGTSRPCHILFSVASGIAKPGRHTERKFRAGASGFGGGSYS